MSTDRRDDQGNIILSEEELDRVMEDTQEMSEEELKDHIKFLENLKRLVRKATSH